MKKILLMMMVVLTGFSIDVGAQDPHFSQWYASPLILNPAMTGLFNGNYRFSAIYRSQWASVLSNESTPLYRTYSASFDMRTNRAFDDHDAFGVGLYFLGDKAGDLNFGTNNFGLSVAYMRALDYDKKHWLSLGFQGAMTQRRIDFSKAQLGVQWDGQQWDGTLPGFETFINDNFLFYDVSIGLLYYWLAGDRSDLYAGFSVFHLNQPQESFQDDGNVTVPMKFVGNIGAHFPLGERSNVDLLPKVITMIQSKFVEMNFGAEVKIFFEKREPRGNAFYIGGMYRMVGGDSQFGDNALNSEAFIITTAFDYQGLTIGASYDVNVSELSNASNTRGGFEIAIAYTGAFDKRGPKTLYCPKF
jgi:type IX secretion system PorP/SprF family membrane protein